MRPLRYSINVTLDGCCDHRAMLADEDLHRHAVENLDQADALLFGRTTYEMMEAAFRPPARTEARPNWMKPFARTIDAAKKYVVSRSCIGLRARRFPISEPTPRDVWVDGAWQRVTTRSLGARPQCRTRAVSP